MCLSVLLCRLKTRCAEVIGVREPLRMVLRVMMRRKSCKLEQKSARQFGTGTWQKVKCVRPNLGGSLQIRVIFRKGTPDMPLEECVGHRLLLSDFGGSSEEIEKLFKIDHLQKNLGGSSAAKAAEAAERKPVKNFQLHIKSILSVHRSNHKRERERKSAAAYGDLEKVARFGSRSNTALHALCRHHLPSLPLLITTITTYWIAAATSSSRSAFQLLHPRLASFVGPFCIVRSFSLERTSWLADLRSFLATRLSRT